MPQPYGPALVIGFLVGGAIILDDHLAPQQADQKIVSIITAGEEIEQAAIEPAEIPEDMSARASKRHRIVMAVDAQHAHDSNQVVEISLETEGAADEVAQLPAVIGAVLDTAEAEGRLVTPEEIEAAIASALGDTTLQDIDVVIEAHVP